MRWRRPIPADVRLTAPMPLELRGELHEKGVCQVAPLWRRCRDEDHRDEIVCGGT